MQAFYCVQAIEIPVRDDMSDCVSLVILFLRGAGAEAAR